MNRVEGVIISGDWTVHLVSCVKTKRPIPNASKGSCGEDNPPSPATDETKERSFACHFFFSFFSFPFWTRVRVRGGGFYEKVFFQQEKVFRKVASKEDNECAMFSRSILATAPHPSEDFRNGGIVFEAGYVRMYFDFRQQWSSRRSFTYW